MAQAQPKTTADPSTDQDFDGEFIIPSDVLEALANAEQTLSTYGEFLVEFTADGIHVGFIDAADAILVDQTIDADDVEHYTMPEMKFGVSSGTLKDLAGLVRGNTPIHFGYVEQKRVFEVTAGDVDYTLAGIATDNVNGKKDKHPEFNPPVVADVPIGKLKRGAKLIDMATGSNHVVVQAGDGDFRIVGDGDTDSSAIDATKDTDDFAFDVNPDDVYDAMYSAEYMKLIPKEIDEATVEIGFDNDHPMRIRTTRADVIDTEIVLAPRLRD